MTLTKSNNVNAILEIDSGRSSQHQLFKYMLGLALSISSINAYADKTCSVTATIAFGAYDPVANTNLNSIGNIDFYCEGNTSVVLKLGLGNGSGASFYAGRRMSEAKGSSLIYNIYTDSGHRHVLGDGTGGSVTLAVKGKFGFSRAIYGSIPAHQTGLLASSYSDMLVITIVY
jgi:spore coat protein U-like protein